MGAKDIKRQKPNCDAMKNGAEIASVYSGSQTLVDAVSECMRYWVSNCDTTHMCWEHCWAKYFCKNMWVEYSTNF